MDPQTALRIAALLLMSCCTLLQDKIKMDVSMHRRSSVYSIQAL